MLFIVFYPELTVLLFFLEWHTMNYQSRNNSSYMYKTEVSWDVRYLIAERTVTLTNQFLQTKLYRQIHRTIWKRCLNAWKCSSRAHRFLYLTSTASSTKIDWSRYWIKIKFSQLGRLITILIEKWFCSCSIRMKVIVWWKFCRTAVS